MYSGVVPQHPPRKLTPKSTKGKSSSANSFASMLYVPVLGSGRPALALTIIGRLV